MPNDAATERKVYLTQSEIEHVLASLKIAGHVTAESGFPMKDQSLHDTLVKYFTQLSKE